MQERLRREVLAGTSPETLLLLEHHPVITLGRSAAAGHVLAPAAELGRRGIAVHSASRGGDVTYHGPGQLVGYPVLRLDHGVVGHLRAMAEGLAEVLSRLGITACWRRETPGLWVERTDGQAGAAGAHDNGAAGAKKICSFGVHVHRRVAIHGFALNVAVDLDAFRLIVPCGLADTEMTSIDRCVAAPPPVLEALAVDVAAAFERSFARSFVRADARDVIAAADRDRI